MNDSRSDEKAVAVTRFALRLRLGLFPVGGTLWLIKSLGLIGVGIYTIQAAAKIPNGPGTYYGNEGASYFGILLTGLGAGMLVIYLLAARSTLGLWRQFQADPVEFVRRDQEALWGKATTQPAGDSSAE
jgi:hypothetical protein